MKLCIKKIYCPRCRVPVRGVEPHYDGPYRILCSKCGHAICVSNGSYWRRGQEGESAPVREGEGGSAGKSRKATASKH
jgi:hypothetical protein